MFDIGANNEVIIKDHGVLLIKEFKAIWDKDKTKTKTKALKEFAYVYFKKNFKSSYRNAYTEIELEKVLKRDLAFNPTWKPTKDILNLEAKYDELQFTKTLKTITSAEKALEQINNYFTSFNIDTLPKEKQSDAITKLMNNIGRVDEMAGKLEAAKKRVAEELGSKKMNGAKVLTRRELPKNQR